MLRRHTSSLATAVAPVCSAAGRQPLTAVLSSVVPSVAATGGGADVAGWWMASPSSSPARRHLSTAAADDGAGSHDDFQPKRKVLLGDPEAARDVIDSAVKSNKVVLFMKGTPDAPQCGFSMQVVRILHAHGVDISSINVLDHPAIREGVKEYSDWPTIPQLYVNGEFVGGCDIVTTMHQNGDLEELLATAAKE